MLHKMMILVLIFVSCLATGQTHYDQLSPGLKTYVDRALVKANQQLPRSYGHLNFHRIGDYAQLKPTVKIDVRLMNTKCRKETEHKHRPNCPFKQLVVRCFVCGRAGMFIDCVHIRDQATRLAVWDDNCPSCDLSCRILTVRNEKMPTPSNATAPPALPSQAP